MAETRAEAEAAFDAFIESYRVKYEKAAECLNKDRDALLTFHDFPAEHWKHLRTNAIERLHQIITRKIDGWKTLSQKSSAQLVDLAA